LRAASQQALKAFGDGGGLKIQSVRLQNASKDSIVF
jgi:hypothetical protein